MLSSVLLSCLALLVKGQSTYLIPVEFPALAVGDGTDTLSYTSVSPSVFHVSTATEGVLTTATLSFGSNAYSDLAVYSGDPQEILSVGASCAFSTATPLTTVVNGRTLNGVAGTCSGSETQIISGSSQATPASFNAVFIAATFASGTFTPLPSYNFAASPTQAASTGSRPTTAPGATSTSSGQAASTSKSPADRLHASLALIAISLFAASLL